MDKIIDITKILTETKESVKQKDELAQMPPVHATNPIFKKLAKFANQKLSQKFDINDLLK